jgi:hypothetical protein
MAEKWVFTPPNEQSVDAQKSGHPKCAGEAPAPRLARRLQFALPLMRPVVEEAKLAKCKKRDPTLVTAALELRDVHGLCECGAAGVDGRLEV